MKKRIATIYVLCMSLIFILTGCSSKSGQYEKAKEMMESGQYA